MHKLWCIHCIEDVIESGERTAMDLEFYLANTPADEKKFYAGPHREVWQAVTIMGGDARCWRHLRT